MPRKFTVITLSLVAGAAALSQLPAPKPKAATEPEVKAATATEVTQVRLPEAEITNRNYMQVCGRATFEDDCQGKTALLRGFAESECYPYSYACGFSFVAEEGSRVTVKLPPGLAGEVGSEILLTAKLVKAGLHNAELSAAKVFSVIRTPKQIEIDNTSYWSASDTDLGANMKGFRQACYDSSFAKWPSKDIAVGHDSIMIAGIREVNRFGFDRNKRKTINLCFGGSTPAWAGNPTVRAFTCTEGTNGPTWALTDKLKISDCTNRFEGNPGH